MDVTRRIQSVEKDEGPGQGGGYKQAKASFLNTHTPASPVFLSHLDQTVGCKRVLCPNGVRSRVAVYERAVRSARTNRSVQEARMFSWEWEDFGEIVKKY